LWIGFDQALLSQIQILQYPGVSVEILALQVFQELPPARHQGQQTAAGVVVLFMGLEMFSQVLDAGGQDGDLNFFGTGIRIIAVETVNQFPFLLSRNTHNFLLSFCSIRSRCSYSIRNRRQSKSIPQDSTRNEGLDQSARKLSCLDCVNTDEDGSRQ
jgi:hypothetical protein